jgi:hypothetical protein
VDSEADTDVYDQQFDAICNAITSSITGLTDEAEPPPVEPPVTLPRVDIEVSGECVIFVNGQQIGTPT